MAITLGGKPCLDPRHLYEVCRSRGLPIEPWFGLVNSFRYGLGAEPGIASLLMRKRDFDEATSTRDTGYPELRTKYTLTFDDGVRSATFPKLFPVRNQCVTPGAESDPDAAYLYQLADIRWFLQKLQTDPATWAQFNLRDPFGTAITSTWKTVVAGVPTAWSWSEMVQKIWEKIFDTTEYPYPGLPFAPDGSPDHFDYILETSPWRMLGHVLDRLACRLKYNPIADTFTIVRYGVADAVADSSLASADILWADYSTFGALPIAKNVNVRYRLYPTTYSQGDNEHSQTAVSTSSLGPYPIDEYALDTVVFDDMASLSGNAAARSTRAAERASDWVRVTVLNPKSRTCLGVNPSVLACLGSQWPDVAVYDRGDGFKTEIARKPWDPFTGWRPAWNYSRGATSKWVRITAGTGTGPYTGVEQTRIGGVFADTSPAVTIENITRAPYNDPGSSTGAAPDFPVNLVIQIWPAPVNPASPTVDRWTAGPWGGRKKILLPVTVACADGTLTVTYVYLTGVDLKVTSTTDVP